MHSLRSRLPPMNSLAVFEAAARRLSFTAAASELGVTQAAVSRQIRTLEDDLGLPLFLRKHRAVQLTAEGERLHAAVRIGLDHIASTTTSIRRTAVRAQVTVATTIAFATFWLMPRIGNFRAAHPGVEVRLMAADHHIEPGLDGVDLAVRYGRGPWPGLRATRLFDEQIFPICSPAYLKERPVLRAAADLPGETLLRMESLQESWIDWDGWLRALGIKPPQAPRGPRFNTYTILVQAALEGQGIALGWRRMVQELLAEGVLVRPVEESMEAEGAYFLLMAPDADLGVEQRALCDWVLEQAAAD